MDNEAVLRWIATRYDTVDRNDGTFFNPQTLVEDYFADLLVTLNPERSATLVSDVAVDVATATLVTTAVAGLAGRQYGGASALAAANSLGQRLSESTASLARSAVERASAGASTVLDVSDDCWRLIWRWHDLKPEDVRLFFKARIQAGAWTALDLLGRLVQSSVPLGVRNPVSRLSGIDEGFVQQVLDLNELTAALPAELDEAGPVPPDRTLVDSPDNRRSYALAWLRARRERNAG